MEALHSMFPDMSLDALHSLLAAHDGDVEATIDAILRMTQESQPSTSSAAPGPSSSMMDVPLGPSVPTDMRPPSMHALERDAQIERDAQLARRLVEEDLNEALREQTPTCFSPVVGMLSSGGGRAGGRASGGGGQAAGDWSETAGQVWNTATQVWNGLSETVSTWMAAGEDDDEGSGGGFGSAPARSGTSADASDEAAASHATNMRVGTGDTTLSQRKHGRRASKKTD